MIVVANDTETVALAKTPSEIVARDLLAACASEMRRQAGAMASLDTALGGVLDMFRGSSDPAGAKAQMSPALLAELQRADQLRQEMDGVARVLELLAGVESLILAVGSETVCACTPLTDLRGRLLSGSGPVTGHRGVAGSGSGSGSPLTRHVHGHAPGFEEASTLTARP
jgi:hypothetical protein